MKIKFKYEIGFLLLLAGIFILMIVSGILVNRNLTRTVDRASIQLQPDERLIVMKSVSRDLLEAENRVYSFNLTRNRNYLSDFYMLINETEKKIRKLKNYSSRDPYYKNYVDSLEKLVILKYGIMDSLLIVQNQYRVNETLGLIEQSMKDARVKESTGSANETSRWKNIFRKKDKAPAKKENKLADLDQFQRDLGKIKKTEGKKEISNNQLELGLIQSDRQVMSKIDSLLATLEIGERNSIALKTKEAREAATQTKSIVLVFSILLTLILFAACFAIVKYIRRNNEYKRFLKKAKLESEEIAASKVKFVSILSHEIRTPLNAIIGFTEQLTQQISGQWSKEQTEQLGYVQKSSAHLSQIVNEILDYTKLQANQVQLEQIPFDPKKEVRDIFDMLQQTADTRQNDLQLVCSSAVPHYISGDSLKFRQIMLNLLSNAIKFTENGKIIVRMHAEEPENEDINLLLEVEDSGIGIETEHLENIFEEFQQENSSISRGYGGTGLGLSITKMLVELHQGKITVKSEKGKGSCFDLNLHYHLCYEPVPQQEVPALKTFSLEGLTVLLADDEPYNRKLLESILNKTNVTILQAEDGQKAWDVFVSEKVDLALIDIQMPKLNGIELCKKIRSESAAQKRAIPIIAVTAGWSEELERESELFHAIVGKPVKEQDLIRVIRQVLSGEKIGFKIANPIEKKSDAAPYNLSGLTEMSNGDGHFVKSMIETFVRTTKEGIAELKLQLEKNELSGMAETAHRISSPCKHLEILNLYQLFKELEREAKASEKGESNETLERLILDIQSVAKPVLIALENERNAE